MARSYLESTLLFVAIALLANTLATGAGLAALILTFGGVSGAHFNPAVTLVAAVRGELSRRPLLRRPLRKLVKLAQSVKSS